MNEVPGLMILASNYQFSKILDTPEELEITTFSNVQPGEAMQLLKLGWRAKEGNVCTYRKPSKYEDAEILEEVKKNFDDASDEEEVLPEDDLEVVPNVEEEDVPPSAGGLMEDV